MANISTTLSRWWKVLLFIAVSMIFVLDVYVRYIEREQHIMYNKNKWRPQMEKAINITKKDELLTPTSMNDISEKVNTSLTSLVNRIHSLIKSPTDHQLTSSVENQKQTIDVEVTTDVSLPTIPGLISMDKDLSLPPEIPKRPDSKEPILPYSQKRDYKSLIKHNNECGRTPTVDLSLKEFDYDRDIFLLIVIKSACSLRSRRDVIRQTWGNESWIKEHTGVRVKKYFLLGDCTTDTLRKDLIKEDKMYNDILQWNFFDSFRNLTLKDCLFMQWFSRNCRSVPYVFKGDDDVFVNVKNIVQYLKEISPSKRKNLFVGSVLRGSPRILDPSWKYYVSYNLYPDKYYPPYVSGGGFILSGDMVFRLFQASLLTRIIPIDDAFLGILLKKIEVTPENDRGFKSWGLKNYSVCRLAKIKTYHKILPDRLLIAWKEISNLNLSSCDKESDDVFTSQKK